MFKIKVLSWDFIQTKLLTWNPVMLHFEKIREVSPGIMMAAEVCALNSLLKRGFVSSSVFHLCRKK